MCFRQKASTLQYPADSIHCQTRGYVATVETTPSSPRLKWTQSIIREGATVLGDRCLELIKWHVMVDGGMDNGIFGLEIVH
jgi:hypothetical protein